MSGEQNGHDLSRLDRIERAMEMFVLDHEQFREQHKLLLTSQILLTDRTDKLGNRMDKLAQSMTELADAQKHTDQRMNALIAVVDGMIRRPPSN